MFITIKQYNLNFKKNCLLGRNAWIWIYYLNSISWVGRSTKLLLDMLSKTCTDFQQLGVMVFTLWYTVELFIYCRLSTFGCYGLYLAIWYTVEDFVDLVWVVDVDNDRMGRSDGIHHHYWLHVLRNKLLQLIKKGQNRLSKLL